MKRAGFTVVELLASLAMVAVISAVLLPSVSAGRASAKLAAAKEKIHDRYLAYAIYTLNWGEPGYYGEPATMGMPPVLADPRNQPLGALDSWESPCGNSLDPIQEGGYVRYVGYLTEKQDPNAHGQLLEDLVARQQNFVAINDFNCSAPGTVLISNIQPKRGLGATLEGRLLDHTSTQRFYDQQGWWNTALDKGENK
ncbi:MAG: type II secretion system protein [Armatimonadetes bacterium]|nr:type II secretion system protein [Armatimonadota bacterium]